MAEEQVFMDQGGIKVTNARVIVDGDTYSLANVTSCKSRYTEHEGIDKSKDRLKKLLLWGGIILGIILGSAVKSFAFGAIIAVVGIVASFFIKSTFDYRIYKVYFGSAAGEQEAISSQDENFIRQIVNAVNDAIVARG